LVTILSSCPRNRQQLTYRIRHKGTKAEIAAAKGGTKSARANFTCIMSGTAITGDHIKEAGKSGRMGQTLIAIVAEGKGGRQYVAPNDDHVFTAFSNEAATIAEEFRETFLSGEVPARLTGGTCHGYGLDQWGKLFTDRQIVALSTFSNLVHEARAQIEQDAFAAGMDPDQTPLRDGGHGVKAYAEAVSVYLAFAVNRSVDRGSSICTWDSSPKMEALRNTFARQALPMTWDFAEGNPFSSASGNVSSNVDWVAKAVRLLVPAASGREVNQDAQSVVYPQNTVISTDPPYYDNIGYADLSDFFFAWMKPAIRPVYPDLFTVMATPKAEELVATAYRHGKRDAAETFFMEGMSRAIKNMATQSSPDYPATIYYAFKQSEISQEGISSTGWATFLQAVVEAGYAVVGTWPMRTEMANRMIASGTNALANSVVLVCRKKEATAEVITRAEFVRALKRELPPAIAKLQAANIAPADMPQSAIGPGMGVFSRYAAVLESDDRPMSVKTALQLINAELDTFLSSLTGDFDAETRFAVTWFEQFGYDKGEFGTALSLCQARGLAVDSVKHAGIIESAAGKVRLLKRSELNEEWDPTTDPHLTIWECLQYLVRALDGGEENAARLLKRIGPERAGAVKDLAYYLYDLAGNKRRDAQEATSYNALIALWSDLTGLASTVRDDTDRQASLF
jgi:putative DNA methylase